MSTSPKKKAFFAKAVESAVAKRLEMIDLETFRNQFFQESFQTAAKFGVRRNEIRDLVAAEFQNLETQTINSVTTETGGVVDLARASANYITEKYRRALAELAEGWSELFEKIRRSSPERVIDTVEFPELAEYTKRLVQLSTESTERSVDITEQSVEQFVSLLRRRFQIELRLIFQQAFIGEPEVEGLVQLYLEELSEVQQAA